MEPVAHTAQRLRRARPALLLVGAALLYAAFMAACHFLLGFGMSVPWDLWQLLDRELLLENPLSSLLLLHAQPPLFNALAAILLQVSSATGLSFETLAASCYLAFGFGTLVATFLLVRRALGSSRWAALAVLGLLLDPGFTFFTWLFFYPCPLELLLAALLLFASRFVARGRWRELAACVGLLSACAWTSTLYRPAWAISFFVLLLLGRFVAERGAATPSAPRWRTLGRRAALLPLVGLLLFAWPLKNYLVFGRFASTSWTGFNLSRTLRVEGWKLPYFLKVGGSPDETREAAGAIEKRFGVRAARAVTRIEKSTGGRNWNHLVMLESGRELYSAAMEWRFAHPVGWLWLTTYFYVCWTLPTYWNPYTFDRFGPSSPAYQGYASVYEAVLYSNLKPTLRDLKSRLTGAVPKKEKSHAPYTVFGLVLLPLLLLSSTILLVRRRPFDAGAITLALALFNVGWVLVIPCLTDGIEGNRMRLAIGSHLVFLVCTVASASVARLSAWRRRRRAGAGTVA
jgi:hypothetical protein